MTGTTQAVRLSDGTGTTLEVWGDSGPLMLLVHGMSSSRRSWMRIVERYGSRFRIAAYDQRGHGESSGVGGPMTLAQCLDDLASVAQQLDEPIDVLIGHSWGGAVAIAGGQRIDARRVVAIDPMLHQLADAWYDEFIAELDEAFAYVGDEREKRVRHAYAGDPELDVLGKIHALATMTSAPIRALQCDNPAPTWDLVPIVAAYDRPLLLAMASPGEGVLEAPRYAELHRALPPLVRYVEFPGAGHSLHRTALDAFSAALDAFLAA
ncbi:MAG: alpha/beta fold hydrolase [Vulcanimicrobiaceae bacterium]